MQDGVGNFSPRKKATAVMRRKLWPAAHYSIGRLTDRNMIVSSEVESANLHLSGLLSPRSRPRNLLEAPLSTRAVHRSRREQPLSLALVSPVSATALAKGLKLFDVLYGPPLDKRRPLKGKSRLPAHFSAFQDLPYDNEPRVPKGKAATAARFKDLVTVDSLKVGKTIASKILKRMSLRGNPNPAVP